jgi:DNA-binding beta-propeller fold protein YncE
MIAACVASLALCGAAPPEPGRGYGLPVRSIDGLQGVEAAIVADDGTVTAALGPHGVVRIGPDGHRTELVAPWPAGGVADAVALVALPDGVLGIADRAGGAFVTVAASGAPYVRALTSDGRVVRPVGLALAGDRLFIADGAEPRVLACHRSGEVVRSWTVPAPVPGGLRPLLGGVAAGGGILMVTDIANDRVVALAPNGGDVLFSKGDRGAFPAMWQSPTGIAWDGAAFVVTDLLNHRVVRVDPRGEVIDQWGQHAVRPREGNGKIHYPTRSGVSPDGGTVAVAEPFERRVQLFGGAVPPDPSKPAAAPLPASDGVASHFSTAIGVDGKTLLVYEPESASALVFDLRNEPPIHVTTFGGPGRAAGTFGQVTALCVDEAHNRCLLADPLRGVLASYALVRDGAAMRYDPFMARLVREASFEPVLAAFAASRAAHPGSWNAPDRLWPIDLHTTPEGTILILDAAGPRIIETDSDLHPIHVFECTRDEPAGARLVLPTQCALAGPDILVVDAADRAIKSYARADGAFRGAWPLRGIVEPFGLAVLPAGEGGARRVAVTDAAGDRVCMLQLDAKPGGDAVLMHSGGTTGSKPGELWEPAAVAWNPVEGRVFVTDHGNHRIQTFAPDGAWQSSFGIGRAWVRPKDPQKTAPAAPENRAPSAEGAADTRAQFSEAARGTDGAWRVPSTDGAWNVTWRFVGGTAGMPPLRNPFDLEVEVTPARGGAPFDGMLLADAAMPQHGHGMNVKPTVKSLGGGRFRVEGMLFHMPGSWEMYLDLVRAGVLERAQGTVTLE